MAYIGAKPADKALTSADIEDSAISTAKIQDNAVTTAKTSYSDAPFRNIIINGDMSINQRNATVNNGTSVDTYVVDRFHMFGAVAAKMSGQQSTTVPTYFKNSFLTTSLASTTPSAGDAYGVRQTIEGSNIANLSWGSASAKTITVSFWVRSSITGTYALALFNSANNRSYVETYTINSADTFEYKTITIEGDTSGTWLTTNGVGIRVWWDLGSGSNFNTTAGSWVGALDVRTSDSSNWIGTSGATFYITGVQLEVGSAASDFEFLPHDVNLQRCLRYYYKTKAIGANYPFGFAQCYSSTSAGCLVNFPVIMRTNPSALEQSGTATDYQLYTASGSVATCSAVPAIASVDTTNLIGAVNFTVASGISAGDVTQGTAANSNAYLAWSAEL